MTGRAGSPRGAGLAAVAALGATFTVTDARADLAEDAARLAAAERRIGAEVEVQPPRFLLAESTQRVFLPLEDPPASRPCITVIALATRHVELALRPALPLGLGLVARPTASRAGVASLESCRGRIGVGAVEIVMGRQAGAVEILVVRHAAEQKADIEVVLPARAEGPHSAPARPPEPLPVGPLGSRLAAAEAGSRRDGATFVARLDYRADARGVGALSLRLREGCHRLHVASEARRADVDAEVRFPGDEEPLRLDRAHAPEARLDFCLGATRDVELRFAGASPSAAVAVMDAHWPLPDGVPSIFGDQARGGFAWALHRRPSPPLGDPPIRLVAGGVGVTQVPLPLEPGACYLAAMAVSRGGALGGRLTVELGARELHDDASDPQRAAAVAFCAGPRDRTASASVELRADQAFWGLALWKLVGGRP